MSISAVGDSAWDDTPRASEALQPQAKSSLAEVVEQAEDDVTTTTTSPVRTRAYVPVLQLLRLAYLPVQEPVCLDTSWALRV